MMETSKLLAQRRLPVTFRQPEQDYPQFCALQQVLRHQRRPRPPTGRDKLAPPVTFSHSGGCPSHFVNQNKTARNFTAHRPLGKDPNGPGGKGPGLQFTSPVAESHAPFDWLPIDCLDNAIQLDYVGRRCNRKMQGDITGGAHGTDTFRNTPQ
jgi:hypothetical protein